MSDTAREIIHEMALNILNCPKDVCGACNQSANLIKDQTETLYLAYEQLKKENEKFRAAISKFIYEYTNPADRIHYHILTKVLSKIKEE